MLRVLRERFHPLFHLRRIAIFRALAVRVDFAVRASIKDIGFPVWVNWQKHAALFFGECGVEREERANFRALCLSNDFKVLWDIGANIGLYSFIFKTLIPDGHVVAFEPDTNNLKLLNRTVAESALNGIAIVPVAISDRCGRALFAINRVTGHTGSLVSSRKPGVTVQDIEVMTIDAQARFSPVPDFIKIDVEGQEWAVLQGGLATISQHKPMIFFEASNNHEEIACFFIKIGYRLFDMKTLIEIYRPVHNTLAICLSRHNLP
jgi:FkbM family methyltransferase